MNRQKRNNPMDESLADLNLTLDVEFDDDSLVITISNSSGYMSVPMDQQRISREDMVRWLFPTKE
jgi:hypothetical protein